MRKQILVLIKQLCVKVPHHVKESDKKERQLSDVPSLSDLYPISTSHEQILRFVTVEIQLRAALVYFQSVPRGHLMMMMRFLAKIRKKMQFSRA